MNDGAERSVSSSRIATAISMLFAVLWVAGCVAVDEPLDDREADAPLSQQGDGESIDEDRSPAVGGARVGSAKVGPERAKKPPKSDTRASKAGAPRVDPNRREKDRKTAVNRGLLGKLKEGGQGSAVSNAFGSGGLGKGINPAMGGLAGADMASAGGGRSLGTRGAGAGGGGVSLGIGGRASTTRAAPWTRTIDDGQSTFAIDVDTASYSIARRAIKAGRRPHPHQVRVEEMINYFRYDYDPPAGDDGLFAIHADGARSPVDASKYILRIGIQAKVIPASERRPASLVFLVDTSGSMQGSDRLALAKKAMRFAAAQLTGEDRLAIATYAGRVGVALPPTAGDHRAQIHRAIEAVSSGGGTAMESGMLLAYQQAMAMKRPGTITRVIVMSDGDANIGATTHGQILQTIGGYVAEGITLSTIGFGSGNYQDQTMEQLANRGNGNYFYIDTVRMAERVFGRDFTQMVQDVAQDVKIQVELDPAAVAAYRLIGYENRDIADHDFRNDDVDAGEIGAGHQVTALYELSLQPGIAKAAAAHTIGTVRVRAKQAGGRVAKETSFEVPARVVDRPFAGAPADFRFATAVMGAAELLRGSPHAEGWTYGRVRAIAEDAVANDPDRRELVALIGRLERRIKKQARGQTR